MTRRRGAVAKTYARQQSPPTTTWSDTATTLAAWRPPYVWRRGSASGRTAPNRKAQRASCPEKLGPAPATTGTNGSPLYWTWESANAESASWWA